MSSPIIKSPTDDRPTGTDPEFSTASFLAADRDRAEREEMTKTGTGAALAREDKPAALFKDNEAQDLRTRWGNVQTGFVDEPRKAVEQADSLVAETMTRLAEIFANERSILEKQWDQGDNISTEDLRVALQRYRSFFNRLLAI